LTDAVVVTDQLDPAPPCGACRQVLFEFGENMNIWLLGGSGVKQFQRLADLLPHAFKFTPNNGPQ
jgi:cytidine deaminase